MSDAPTLTEREVARRLGLSPFTLRAWRRQGRGPAYMKLGKTVRYRVADVDAYQVAMRIDPINTGASSELTPQ